jgi:peptidoglycan/xylan/chitin deacetylase (PgdA/CDA1 family)
LCAVSVDLDEIPCYTAIHGLPAPPERVATAIYRRALPRLVELFDRMSLPVTFFGIGRDLEQQHAREAAAELARRGHELGNHSYDHFYDLTRRERSAMREQVARCSDAIASAAGAAPVGFRAPGYTINDTLFDVLSELGLRYDSSVFPCPGYYMAKATAISGYRLLGRRSHSVVDHPRVLAAPAEPYRVGTPYSRRGAGMLELPIGVTRERSGRLPFIGTNVVMAGERMARWFSDRIAGRGLVNLELHGIDGADADEDGLRDLARHQPDLRVTARAKLSALRAALERLREHGYRFVTLAEAAQAFSR